MSEYFKGGNGNGTQYPFTGEIKQETGRGREDMVMFPPEDKGRTIIDYDIYGRETEEEKKLRIWKAQTTFLIDVERLEEEEGDTLETLVDKVKAEHETEIPVRVEFDKIMSNWDYWNAAGRVTKMMIAKPRFRDDAVDLSNWTVTIYCDEYCIRAERKTVLEALDHGDRYLIAWYAMWRRWPLQYKNWEWAARFKEVTHACRPPNSSYYYKEKWLTARDLGMVNIQPSFYKENWDVTQDKCPWEEPGPDIDPWMWGPVLEDNEYPEREWERDYDHNY